MDIAYQAPLSMEFSRRNTGVKKFLSPEDLSDPGIEPRSPALQVDSFPSEPPGKLIVSSSKKSRFAKLSQLEKGAF